MPALNYLSEYDKIRAFQKYRPILNDLSKDQLELALLMIINGTELDYAIDLAMASPRE